MAVSSLCGCGAGVGTQAQSNRTVAGEASYANLPPTHEQQLVERGAHLFVVHGCSSCHAIGGSSSVGPSFARLAGNRVTLADGRHVLVDASFLHKALLNPRAAAVKGYSLAPMLAAVERLQLKRHPADITALAAFIEQIGPEG